MRPERRGQRNDSGRRRVALVAVARNPEWNLWPAALPAARMELAAAPRWKIAADSHWQASATHFRFHFTRATQPECGGKSSLFPARETASDHSSLLRPRSA